MEVKQVQNVNAIDEALAQARATLTPEQYAILEKNVVGKGKKRNNQNTISRKDFYKHFDNLEIRPNVVVNVSNKRLVGFTSTNQVFVEHEGKVVQLPEGSYSKVMTAIEESIVTALTA